METLHWQFNLWRKTKQKWELYVFACACVYLCAFGPTTVWLGPRAQNAVQTSTQKKGDKKKREGLSRRQTRTFSLLNQKHKACLFRGGISERIREESRRNHKTCFMLATVKEDCRVWRGSDSEQWREAKREAEQSQWQHGCYGNRLAQRLVALVPNLNCWVLACVYSFITVWNELHAAVSFEQMQIMFLFIFLIWGLKYFICLGLLYEVYCMVCICLYNICDSVLVSVNWLIHEIVFNILYFVFWTVGNCAGNYLAFFYKSYIC